MVRARLEQRNRYEGIPQRPWVAVRLVTPGGLVHPLKLLADTGSPFPVVISPALLATLAGDFARETETNFGKMSHAWVRLTIHELDIDTDVRAYGSDAVVHAARASHRSFDGLIGLPLLRMTEYGGDADFFWLREATR